MVSSKGPARLLIFLVDTLLLLHSHTAPPAQRRRPGTGAISTVPGPRTSGQEQSSTVHGECTSNEALRNGMPTPGYTGRAYGPAHAAVHLSHREELDEELHDPGGTSNDH